MYKYLAILIVCFSTLLGFGQSSPKYQAASILEVVPLHTTVDEGRSTPVYKISLQINNTVYEVLYTYVASTDTMRYSVGMQIPVLVGENSIKFNDILGRSYEVPIIAKRSTALAKK